MWWRHVSGQLARYCDGEVDPAEAQAIDAHLATCRRCRAECDEIRFAASLLRRLEPVAAPRSIWPRLADGMDAMREGGRTAARGGGQRWTGWLAGAAAAALLLAAATATWVARAPARPWDVARVRADAARTDRLAAGTWVDTDDGSRARITVGTIGTVDVEPASRVRLGAVRPQEYRLELARGTISARIAAPPRVFFVETPASTVVDLGCAYTVQVDERGTGNLHVTEGWASLEWKGRESLVPAGALCRIDADTGPGTPFFADASPALQQALAAFDAGGGGDALTTILSEARVRDTLTLWHLLSRVDPAARGLVYDRIAGLTPVPPGVTRERALQLDRATITRWREELAWTW
jgi:hypothetical protein